LTVPNCEMKSITLLHYICFEDQQVSLCKEAPQVSLCNEAPLLFGPALDVANASNSVAELAVSCQQGAVRRGRKNGR
ncbi:hypothetical protein AVEN_15534-1, partial [Araneus ventricosus]